MCCLVGWLVGWLFGWLFGLVGWLVGWLDVWLVVCSDVYIFCWLVRRLMCCLAGTLCG